MQICNCPYAHVLSYPIFKNPVLSLLSYQGFKVFGYFSGVLYEAKGLCKEALAAFANALEIDPTHVPSLVSTAIVLKRLGDKPSAVARNCLTDALRLDRTNHSAWYNLGLLYAEDGGRSTLEAAECFQAAVLLEESAPVEPFR